MKALQVFFMLIPFSLLAQPDSSYGYSRFQRFIMQPGRMVHISTDTIAVLGSVETGTITALDLNTGEKMTAICFLPGSLFNSTVFTETSTQLDMDELEPFLRILDTVNRIIYNRLPIKAQEFRYVSSGLTEIVASNRIHNRKRWDVVIYRRYRQFQAQVPGSLIGIRESDIEPLLQLLTRFQAGLGNDPLKNNQ